MWAQTAELSDTQGTNKLFLKVYILLLIIWVNLILPSTLKRSDIFFSLSTFYSFFGLTVLYQRSYFFSLAEGLQLIV